MSRHYLCQSLLLTSLVFNVFYAGLSSPSPVQSVEKTFHLTRADKDLLTKQEYDIQVGVAYK